MAPKRDAVLAKTTGKAISTLRKSKIPGHGGQGKCAQKFGISPKAWSQWENGSRTPSDTNQRKLAAFFGVSVTMVRGEIDQSSRGTPILADDEILDNGDMTVAYVKRHFDCIPEGEAELYAIRLNKLFGSGLLRRAEERSLAPFYRRVQELRDSGMAASEAEIILTKEGYFGSMPLILSR